MNKLKLMDEGVLLTFLRVTLGFEKFVGGDQIIIDYDKNRKPLIEQLEYADLSLQGLFQIRSTISFQATLLTKKYLILQKQQSEFVVRPAETSGSNNLIKRGKEIANYIDYLKKKYGFNAGLERDDLTTIREKYPEIEKTLISRLMFTKTHVSKLKRYLDKYIKQYCNKELLGQARFATANRYIEILLSKINEPSYIATFGTRIVVDNQEVALFFCHTLLVLQYQGLIKIRNIRQIGNKFEAEIDNLAIGEKFHKSPTERDYWYEDKQLKFRLTNGGTDQLDFSKAEVARDVFEAFWELWKGNRSGQYSQEEIKAKYKELHQRDLKEIGISVSNIKASIINPKPLIKDRIKWGFDRKNKIWVFKILPLSR